MEKREIELENAGIELERALNDLSKAMATGISVQEANDVACKADDHLAELITPPVRRSRRRDTFWRRFYSHGVNNL